MQQAPIKAAPQPSPLVPANNIVGPSNLQHFQFAAGPLHLGYFASQAAGPALLKVSSSTYPSFNSAIDLARRLEVRPSIETLKTLEMAELAKEQRDPRKRPRTETNYLRGRTQGLEARITAAPPKEKDDELEEVVSLGGTEDEEMPDFGSGDIYGDPSFEGPYNQGDDDGDIEIAELAGIAYWQVPPTSLVMCRSNSSQTDVDKSPVCNTMLISCCSHNTCEPHNMETKDWMIDSGVSLHFTGEIDDFIDYTEMDHKFGVNTANSSATVVGKGTIILMLDSGSAIRLQPVYYVPGLTSRLLSMGTFLAQGFQAIGTQSFIRIVRAG